MGLNELDMSRSSKYVPRTANTLVEVKSKHSGVVKCSPGDVTLCYWL